MTRQRGQQNRKAHLGLNTPLLLACLAHIARHGGVAIPDLLEVVRKAGYPVSRATLGRMLTDAEFHLGVRVRWRYDMSLPSHGEYWVEDWGVLHRGRVLARGKQPSGGAGPGRV